ncbi:cyclase family protein [Glutamicibacter sp. NPDC127525]|uniref:cyclase family protein n=1 Tax=unclassified Glutamicibacter TaxID=2627139 RepID=UPI003638D14D
MHRSRTRMAAGERPSYEELKSPERNHPGTAWGVFGDQDQLGTLNLLSNERVVEASGLIKTGQRFNLNLPLDYFDPPLIAHRGALEHKVFGLNKFHRDDKIDNFYPQSSTQLDSLRHFAHPDHGFYNGFPDDSITKGTSTLGIQSVAEHGIAGRGLLLDIARYRDSIGLPINHQDTEQISVQDLESTLKHQKVQTREGDILLLRFGWLQHYATVEKPSTNSAGLEQSEDIAAWLWDQKISVVAADNIAVEAWPPNRTSISTLAEQSGRLETSSHTGMLHRILIPLLGFSLGELWNLDSLAERCHQLNRYESFIFAQPLNLVGGVGSPANAIAIL